LEYQTLTYCIYTKIQAIMFNSLTLKGRKGFKKKTLYGVIIQENALVTTTKDQKCNLTEDNGCCETNMHSQHLKIVSFCFFPERHVIGQIA
jgi:hypothetical protein